MKRFGLALCAAAFVVTASSPSNADYSIVRWANRDCKIWFNASDTPKGKVLYWRQHHHWHHKVATWDRAWARLVRLQKHHRCTTP